LSSVRRVLLLSSFALGCVNDYVVRDDAGDETGSTTGPSTGGTSENEASATPDPDTGTGTGTGTGTDTLGDEASGSGGDPSSGGGGDTDAPQFTCEPCTADDQCGDDFDNCVDLGDAGPRCVFSCPEAGCPPDLDCAATTSLDGTMAVQCVPVAPMC
jgi:hypothetical protein